MDIPGMVSVIRQVFFFPIYGIMMNDLIFRIMLDFLIDGVMMDDVRVVGLTVRFIDRDIFVMPAGMAGLRQVFVDPSLELFTAAVTYFNLDHR